MNDADRVIVVSGADAGYFHHLHNLVQSFLAHRPVGQEHVQLGILDFGMTPQQLDDLRPLVQFIVPGRWDFEFPERVNLARAWQGLTVRPFLRNYFEGYGRYLWIDADIWLQDWRVISLMSQGKQDDVIVTPEIHCAYSYLYGMGTLGEFNRKLCVQSFGAAAANLLVNKPIINAGMFSIARNSPCWSPYGSLVMQGFKNGANKWTEQLAMNLAMYAGNMKMHPLPAWCNWICAHVLPVYDPIQKCLCEPTAPYQKLSAVHMTGMYDEYAISTTTGGTMRTRIDYSSIHKLQLNEKS